MPRLNEITVESCRLFGRRDLTMPAGQGSVADGDGRSLQKRKVRFSERAKSQEASSRTDSGTIHPQDSRFAAILRPESGCWLHANAGPVATRCRTCACRLPARTAHHRTRRPEERVGHVAKRLQPVPGSPLGSLWNRGSRDLRGTRLLAWTPSFCLFFRVGVDVTAAHDTIHAAAIGFGRVCFKHRWQFSFQE